MSEKIKQAYNNHKCALFIFVFIVVYNFLIVRKFNICMVDEITYTYHLVNFSVGFCTKILPGALFDFISPSTDVVAVNIYFNIIYHIFLIVLALVVEKFIHSFDTENRFNAFLLVMFFVCGPATLSIHTYQFGMLDTYWLFFAVLLVIFVQNKYLKWLVPILFVAAILIHVSVIVAFLPFFFLVLLFECSNTEEKRKGNIVIFAICTITTLIALAYFVVCEGDNILLSVEEFREFLDSRNKSEWETYTTYYEYALYKLDSIDDVNEDFSQVLLVESGGAIANFVNSVWAQIYYIAQSFSVNYDLLILWIHNVVITLPVIIFLYKYIIACVKKSTTNRFKKFVLCCSLALFPLVFLASSLFSPDINRWYGHNFISLFGFAMYVMYKNNFDNTHSVFKNSKVSPPYFKTIIYLVLYSLYIVGPYY